MTPLRPSGGVSYLRCRTRHITFATVSAQRGIGTERTIHAPPRAGGDGVDRPGRRRPRLHPRDRRSGGPRDQRRLRIIHHRLARPGGLGRAGPWRLHRSRVRPADRRHHRPVRRRPRHSCAARQQRRHVGRLRQPAAHPVGHRRGRRDQRREQRALRRHPPVALRRLVHLRVGRPRRRAGRPHDGHQPGPRRRRPDGPHPALRHPHRPQGHGLELRLHARRLRRDHRRVRPGPHRGAPADLHARLRRRGLQRPPRRHGRRPHRRHRHLVGAVLPRGRGQPHPHRRLAAAPRQRPPRAGARR